MILTRAINSAALTPDLRDYYLGWGRAENWLWTYQKCVLKRVFLKYFCMEKITVFSGYTPNFKETLETRPSPWIRNDKWRLFRQGWIQRGQLGQLPHAKTTIVTLFTTILYNSENSICDRSPFFRPRFCHSSFYEVLYSYVVYHFISLIAVNP